MLNLLNIISNHIAKRNLSFDSDSLINLLDIGCSSFIPPHFVKYARVINLIGCDPDLIGIKNSVDTRVTQIQPHLMDTLSLLLLSLTQRISTKTSL